MDYEPSLSTTNAKSLKDKQKVYYCYVCKTLYVIKEFTTKTAIGGVLVMSLSNLKRAGYHA